MIKSIEVKRDECGMFFHKDLPQWDEGTPQADIILWFKENNGTWFIDNFEDSASDEMLKKWYEDYDNDCSGWMPECNKESSFLLSIHDTDDGPVGLFFVPNVAQNN